MQPFQLPHPVSQRRPVRAAGRLRLAQDGHRAAESPLHQYERFDDFSAGTGLLDMFDRYNFTVNEAEPLEKEVAIDPEMLGKVFENLIEENLRKGLGSYYTPREIVHYMCQESLINYLDTALNPRPETIGTGKTQAGRVR